MKTENHIGNSLNAAANDGSVVAPSKQYFDDTKERSTWYYTGSALSDLKIVNQSIWDEYRGSGIKVGVLDSQIDFTHADLASAYNTSLDYNFALGTGNPVIDQANLPYNHGTRVAGIIAAEGNNGIGSVGIAPNVTLVGFGIDYSAPSAVNDILKGLEAGVSVDVLNNSWSFTKALSDNFAIKPQYEAPLIKLATEGRGGLGTSVVFAAGNEGDYGSSNFHNFQNSPYTIAVGAVEADGDAARFSSRGANVLLSAGGVDVFTTDVGGGYAEADGTSFAAPAVSATIALMLEANPELGYRDVQKILAYSSVRDGLDDTPLFGDGWRYTGTNTHNGGGLHFSDAFGFGFLNVHNAVRLAETWQAQSTVANRTSVSETVTPTDTMTPGKDNSLSFTFKVTDALSLEHVQLSLKTNYGSAGDLDIFLTSPDGTKVRLVYNVDGDDKSIGDISGFTFASVASMGESAKGIWTVEVVNQRNGSTNKKYPALVTVTEATLTLHGSALALEDDTYIYTDEFIGFYTGDDLAARSKLTDTDGGIDTINAAAIGDAVVVDLSGALASNLGGQALKLVADQIENLFTGDGNDKVYGSAVNNVIATGRGNDALYFSLGKDKLDGGQGIDTLFVSNSLADLDVKVTDEGKVYISAGAQVYSVITNVEIFKLGTLTYSLDKLKELLGLTDTPPSGGDGTPGGGGGTDSGGGDGGGEDPDDGGSGGGDPEEPANPYFTIYEGTGGNDAKTGSSFADLLLGEGGKDQLYGDSGNDVIDGGIGADKLYGQEGVDDLRGGMGTDLLQGGLGDDVLWGGIGADTLTGGAGADTFVFDMADIGTTDIITDFNAAQGDRIVISGLSQASTISHSFVTRDATVYLQIDIGDESFELAKLRGVNPNSTGLDSVEIDLLFA